MSLVSINEINITFGRNIKSFGNGASAMKRMKNIDGRGEEDRMKVKRINRVAKCLSRVSKKW
jgi:hypothetical protein